MNSFKGWQQKFEELLQECHDMGSITEVYHYLSTYLIENPETMVAPFERSLECLVTYVLKLADDPYITPNDLHVLDIDKMLGTIERQFPDHFIQLDKPLGFLSKTLADVKRTEMKGKAEEWVKTIESFRKKFSEKGN